MEKITLSERVLHQQKIPKQIPIQFLYMDT